MSAFTPLNPSSDCQVMRQHVTNGDAARGVMLDTMLAHEYREGQREASWFCGYVLLLGVVIGFVAAVALGAWS